MLSSPTQALTIIPTFSTGTDATVDAAINAAINTIDSLYTNPVTIPVTFTFTPVLDTATPLTSGPISNPFTPTLISNIPPR
jgi:hypothetical protein